MATSFVPLLTLQGLPRRDARRYADRLATPAALRGPLNWYRAAARSGSCGPVAVPTTFVWGNRDPALGRKAAESTGEHVTGTYVFTELQAGHWLPETRADECATAILGRITPAS